MRRLVLAVAAAFFASLAWADVVPPRPKSTCDDPVSNLDMRQCAYAEYKAADAELNAVYLKALKFLRETYGPEEIKQAGGQNPAVDLRDAQKKWVAFRDANCRSLGTQMLGGSGQQTIVAGCLASMTKERVTELKTFLPE
jgi:uncharacterized protein YecT (DUF1311 family)